MDIEFTFGGRQVFRNRTYDLNVVGRIVDAEFPLVRSEWSLNQGSDTYLYIEAVPDPGIDWTYQYKESPSVNRLRDLGDFNIEIPTSSPELRPGNNELELRVTDSSGQSVTADLTFSYDSEPLPTALDCTDVGLYGHIQEFGQVINGAFDLDPDQNLIRNRAPVYVDSFLVVGSLHRSQRATYDVRFTDFTKVKWLGPSDFFAGHAGPEPPIGIKPGWSSAGLVALSPRNEARMFLAYGDHVGTDREWVVQTMPYVRFFPVRQVWYHVIHEVRFKDNVNSARFKIWHRGSAEPKKWLLSESDTAISGDMPRHTRASFGLFQHSGMPNEWANIVIEPIS